MNKRAGIGYGNIESNLVNVSKKFVRIKEGAVMYSVGRHTFRKLAEEAHAVYKVGNIILVNIELLDEYLNAFQEYI